MWLYEEGTMRRLTYKETIQRIYPFVDISEIKEPENENNEEKGIIAHDEKARIISTCRIL